MFQIKSRFTGAVLFECELPAEVADKECGAKLGFAVKKAVEADADLAGANLADANLAGADLAGADLAGADLAGAEGAFDLGHPDGWRSVAYLAPDGIMRLRIGCRDKSLAEGRDYWSGKNDRREVMAALNYAEVIARLRGWKVE